MTRERAIYLVSVLTDDQVMKLTRQYWPCYWCGDDWVTLIDQGRAGLIKELTAKEPH